MKLHTSGEDYLKTIFVLWKEKGYADEQAVQKLKRAQQQKIQSEHTPPKSKKKRIDFER